MPLHSTPYTLHLYTLHFTPYTVPSARGERREERGGGLVLNNKVSILFEAEFVVGRNLLARHTDLLERR